MLLVALVQIGIASPQGVSPSMADGESPVVDPVEQLARVMRESQKEVSRDLIESLEIQLNRICEPSNSTLTEDWSLELRKTVEEAKDLVTASARAREQETTKLMTVLSEWEKNQGRLIPASLGGCSAINASVVDDWSRQLRASIEVLADPLLVAIKSQTRMITELKKEGQPDLTHDLAFMSRALKRIELKMEKEDIEDATFFTEEGRGHLLLVVILDNHEILV